MSLSVGTRVAVKGDPGTIRFIGRTQFSTGQWVGIELDVPNGKNDGSVKGDVYFECQNKSADKHYGLFVRPGLVKIIDTPPNPSQPVRRHISNVPSPDLRPSLDGKFNTLSPQLDNNGFGAPLSVPKRQNRLLRQPSTPVLQPAFDPPRILKGDSISALNNQIERLKSKLKVMERKRLEDRDRTTSDSRKIAKLENIVKRLQVKLQPMHEEIQSLRQRINELEMTNSSFTNQISDQDALEMATLDREMAEEKSETLQLELNALRQKFEDLELECEILKEENALYASSQSGGEGDQATIIRLEKRNEKLETALIKLREVYNSQELSHQKETVELEEEVNELKSAVVSLQQTKDKLEDADTIILDLRQQLDNALGAEDMIESLTEKNLEYSEKIAQLEATIEELETLKELNDELEANHVFREKELMEEIESLHADSRRSVDSLDQLEERNAYYESTILKFRDLVNSLNAQLEDQKSSSGNMHTINQAKEFVNMDLNLTTSGFIRTLELELQKFESQQVIQQLEIVKCYLPEDYNSEAPSIDFFLRLKRIALQSMLTRRYIRETFTENLTLNGKICGLLIDVEYFCLALVETISKSSSDEFVKYGSLEAISAPMAELLSSAMEQIKSKELRETEFLKIANSHWMKLRRLADDIPATVNAHTLLEDIHDLCDLAGALLHCIRNTEIGLSLATDLEHVVRTKVISKNLMAELSEHADHTLNLGDVEILKAVRETAKSISNYLISISSKIDEESEDYETCAIHINSLQPQQFAEQLFDIKKVKMSTLVEIDKRDEPWVIHAKRMQDVKDREKQKTEMIEKLEDQEKKLKAALRGKEKMIEELDVKVGLLNSKLSKAKDQDHIIRELRKSLQVAAESDKKLREDIEKAKKEFEARRNAPQRSVDLTTKDLSVLSLQNQVRQLQGALHVAVSKQSGMDTRWLKEPIVNHKGVVRSRLQLSCKQLFRDLRDAVDRYEPVSVRRTSLPNAHASARLRHLAQIEGLENIKLQIMHLLT